MTATWLEEMQQRISHLRERVTKAPEASKADLEMVVDRIADSFKVLAATAEEASKEAKGGAAQRLLGSLHGLRVQGQQAVSALKTELRFIEKNLEAMKPDEPRSEFGRAISVPHTLRSRPHGAEEEDRGGRRLAGMEERAVATGKFKVREAVAAGFTAVTLYIDGERVQIGDPNWIKMTDDIEGTVEELKKKYRGAKVTVTPTGEREVMIEVERKKGSRLSERAAPTGEDLTHEIWREIGRWLESGEEFELGDIDEGVVPQSPAERRVLEKNILFVVLRELEKKVGKLPAREVEIEIDKGAVESSIEDDKYRAVGSFRIWHDQDSAAQGSFAAEGTGGETTQFGSTPAQGADLQNMTISITQASGHGKKNPSLRFF